MDSKMSCIIWTRFLCHFQNGASLFCTPKTGEVIKQFVNFHPFLKGFAKMAMVTIYMLQTLPTGSTFFQKGLYYLLKMFLGPKDMDKVPKKAKMCQRTYCFIWRHNDFNPMGYLCTGLSKRIATLMVNSPHMDLQHILTRGCWGHIFEAISNSYLLFHC